MQPEKNIFGKTSYRDFYRNSEIRTNLLSWLKLPQRGRILVINEEKTCLVELLKQNGNRVTCIQDTEVFTKAEGWYDVIFQMGSLDCGDRKPQDVYEQYFEVYKEHLTERGRLFLAVDNRLGLKYFAGCKDEGTDTYFAGIEGYPDASRQKRAALSGKEYNSALEKAQFTQIERYYPYPDIRFPMAVYSDEWLPGEGELNANIRNFDRDRYVLFDETKVFDSLIKEGLFREFSNSYFYVCRKIEEDQGSKTLYVKFSNERDERFQIRTDIVQAEDGSRYVRKHPLSDRAKEHIYNMGRNYELLSRANGESTVHFCPVEIQGEDAISPFVSGVSLQKLLLNAIEERNKEKAAELFESAVQRLRQYYKKQKNVLEKVTDLDMIFSNILVDGEDWNIIDYEWTFPGDIPPEFVLYRTMFRAALELPASFLTDWNYLYKVSGITEASAKKYRSWENEFQNYITGEQIPARDMVEMLGNQVIPFLGNQTEVEKEVKELIRKKGKKALDIYFHVDNESITNGKVTCSGWACALIKKKHFIPVNIHIFEDNGKEVICKIERSVRKDVGEALAAEERQWMVWGFHTMFTAKEGVSYKLRFTVGELEKETMFTGVNE